MEAPLDLLERFLPADLAPARAVADERSAEAIGVVVHVAEDGALGTHVAAAPDVFAVGADPGDAAVLDGDLEAAHGLAEGERPIVSGDSAHRATLSHRDCAGEGEIEWR
jgi:hypothetical protein